MRSRIAALLFFQELTRTVGMSESIIPDSGLWYDYALRRLGVKYILLSGDVWNYIECWFKASKERVRCFDICCLTKKGDLCALLAWLTVVVLYYTNVRYHQMLKSLSVPLCGYREYKWWKLTFLADLTLF